MHPAKSVIYFTTATGAGYGLFIWIAIMNALNLLPADQSFGFVALGISFALVVSGLLSSTLHLGHPERAWRAFSQWRSSWLSREGVMAVLSFIPMSIFAVFWVFLGKTSGVVAIIGLIGAFMAFITVYTTSMIYASIKAIPAWHNFWTKIGYLVFCLMSGAVLAIAIFAFFGQYIAVVKMAIPALVLLVLGLIVKLFYWAHILKDTATSTAESATGLGRFGKVSLAGSPHSADNYLLKEMGFRIARKHAAKIRVIALIFAFVIPCVLLAIAYKFGGGSSRALVAGIAFLSCWLGLAFERWLFFAEAKHAVTLYYGETRV